MLLKRNVQLSILFDLGSKLLGVPNEYINLKDISSNDFGDFSLAYKSYKEKPISQIMEEDPEKVFYMIFDLELNIEKYAKDVSDSLLKTFLDDYGLEEEELKKDFTKHMKNLFHTIFREIKVFEPQPLTYGKLFQKIRERILTKLEKE